MLKTNYLKYLSRLIISGILVYGLFYYELININLTKKIWDGPYFIISLLFIFLSFIFGTLRWIYAVETLEGKLKKPYFFALNHMIYFFGLFLPGALFLDSLKVILLKRQKPDFDTSNLILISIYDRFIGLFTISLFSFVTFILYYNSLSQYHENLIKILSANAILFLLLVLFLIINIFNLSSHFIKLIPYERAKIFLERFAKASQLLGKRTLLFLFVSSLSQIFGLLAFYFINKVIFNLSLVQISSIVPLGFITLHIPISPNGLGTGHLSFDQLFGLFNIENGGDLFNSYFILYTIFQLTGFVSFLFFKRKKELGDLDIALK